MVAVLFQDLADREDLLWPVVGLVLAYGLAVAFWGVFEYKVGPFTILLVLLSTAYAV